MTADAKEASRPLPKSASRHGRGSERQRRPCARRDPSPPALIVAEGNYPIAQPIGRSVWVPAFAGTTMVGGEGYQLPRIRLQSGGLDAGDRADLVVIGGVAA